MNPFGPSADELRFQALATAAKQGDETAKEELKKYNLRVWNQEKLDMVNFYLDHENDFKKAKHYSDQSLYVYHCEANQVEFATILWLLAHKQKLHNQNVYMACLEYDNGVLSYWMSWVKQGAVYPIADVSFWANRPREYGATVREREICL